MDSGEEVDEVAGGESGMDMDRIAEVGVRATIQYNYFIK